MPRPKIWNVGKLHAESEAAHAKADTALTAAKITTIRVEGKDVPFMDAPLSDKITALAGLLATGSPTDDNAQLISTNSQIATQLEDTEARLAVAQATISGQVQQIAKLQGELTVANAGVNKLTASNATNENLTEASNREVVRLGAQLAAQQTELVNHCMEANCLDLRGDDGKPLTAEATDAQRRTAANKMAYGDLFKAYKGAVNSAMAKTGLTFANVPNAMPSKGHEAKQELKGRDRFKAAVKVQGQTARA